MATLQKQPANRIMQIEKQNRPASQSNGNGMTVSYNLDVSSVNSLAFAKLLCNLFVWVVAYYVVALVYRCVLDDASQKMFARISNHLDDKLGYIPLTFMLGFFVTIVVDRWKQIFNNIGFIENVALSVCSLIRGSDNNVRLARRSIIRYIVLSQVGLHQSFHFRDFFLVLVFRDISMRVRRRFPTMKSLVEAGFLFENELQDLEASKLGYNKYWVPINWANTLICRMHTQKYLETPVSLNNVLNNVKEFRVTLEQLCKYDWVPIPIAYPQVVFLAVRMYFLVCLVSRQYIIHEFNDESPVVYLPRWLDEVAEALLNPLGEDDDDFEGNWIIDKNIETGMAIVDEAHDVCPILHVDRFSSPQFVPMYSEQSAQHAVNKLTGSASHVESVPKPYKIQLQLHRPTRKF
ncbi:unnamed protein product [Caenorhabditis auriculariae]|uniref:Bestrophin homolog n=1 Tax=Caenorhabditis auriculariae TaxID=2777116 RepID=A0A8S1HG06_9PELO|nr:unnamed protein product [Caenorhabditis auriculariae]